MIFTNYINELSVQKVYEFLRLRQDVFILEQNCFYEDIDGLDDSALHVCYTDDNGRLMGYLRILPPAAGQKLSIGRVVVKRSARNRGIGRALMESAIKECQTRYPEERITISAQTYLIDFYTSLGFEKIGDVYMEDGIEHQGMEMPNSPKTN